MAQAARGDGMSIGSELDSGARDILVRNLTVDDTPLGVRTKSDVGRGGLVERVAYGNVCLKSLW
ncbi:hypothetical protein E4K65_42015 [Bradyrhizobium niftali]|uniref:Polygalacturonase n=2 Tax=Bradyrhizobium niftali TaxID=2560055 RepID=A0A4Y9L4I6_9BRAD|nr:glycosyl hydrolase family 28 protein [Bradyrhizobium niftali]TFV38468.1 hypothetical protein E4K65_42015 [Bradyrhizobium niftali]